MPTQIIIVIILTFIIHCIGTLAYSVRLVGTRTKKIAISFALFNVMVLIARTSNAFQAPLLAKWIENNLSNQINRGTFEFRVILFTATIATIFSAFLIPSFQRILAKAVNNFSIHKSIPNLISKSLSVNGFRKVKEELSFPNKTNFDIVPRAKFPLKIFILNTIVVSILTAGVLSSLYAGFIIPELRTTANSLSSIVNGMATILLFLIIDPFLSLLTDEVVEGKYQESDFITIIRVMVLSRILGTLLAQFFLVPFAYLIAWIAGII